MISSLVPALISAFKARRELTLEDVALRQQARRPPLFGETAAALECRPPKGRWLPSSSLVAFADRGTPTDTSIQTQRSNKRLVKKSRIKNIERYIKGGGFFPNSIILNIQSKKKPTFDLAGRGEHSSKAAAGVLHLPKKYQSALIIDGQHRLFGYGLTDERLTNLIPAVAFLNLPAQKQSEMFVTINHEQRSVPANLLMSLFAEFHWGSADEGEALNSALTKLVERMNSRNDSMLYKRIVLGET